MLLDIQTRKNNNITETLFVKLFDIIKSETSTKLPFLFITKVISQTTAFSTDILSIEIVILIVINLLNGFLGRST